MSEALNTQIVKDAYAAFGRGDVNAILATLDEHVEWEGVKGTEGVVPTAGLRRGRAEVGQFFSQVNESIAFERFEPRQFVAQGDIVVALGYYSGTAKPTGRTFSSDWVMVFTLKDGRVTQFQEFADSAALVKAFATAAAV
jgi:ketosteroid isomerase-like protein